MFPLKNTFAREGMSLNICRLIKEQTLITFFRVVSLIARKVD